MVNDIYQSVARDVMTTNYQAWLSGEHDSWRKTFHDDVAFVIQPSAAFTVPWAGIYIGFESVNAFNQVMLSCMLWDKSKIFYGHFKPNSAEPSNTNLCELDVNVVGTFAPSGNHFDFWMHYYVEAKDGQLFRLLKTFDESQVARQFWGKSQPPVGQVIDGLKLEKMLTHNLPLSIAPTLQTKWR